MKVRNNNCKVVVCMLTICKQYLPRVFFNSYNIDISVQIARILHMVVFSMVLALN